MDPDPSGNLAFQFLLLIFFTFLNAFFAGAEMAVVSVNKKRIRALADEGNTKARFIQGLFEDSTRFLSAIQVAITFAGFYSSASAAAGISPVFARWLASLGVPYSSALAYNSVTLVLMFFNLVFGELVPKRIALQKAEAFCMVTVMPIHYLSIVLAPFTKLLSISTKVVLRLLGLPSEDQEEAITAEEIKALMEAGHQSGVFDEDKVEMVDSALSFGERTAREAMVPRQKVFMLDINESLEEMLDEILQSRHSRIPVYQDEFDDIIGILHVKDVMIGLRRGQLQDGDIRSMLHKAYFVPEMKDAADLFRAMQSRRERMAVLVDEYGGFSGIVTIEDLVEMVMGDIREEYEDAEAEITPLGDGDFLVDGTTTLTDLNEELDLRLESDECDTLSGYLIEQLGFIPQDEEAVSVSQQGYLFTAKEIQGRTIAKVLMHKLEEEHVEAEATPA